MYILILRQFELQGGLQEIKQQNLMIESDLREEKAKAEVLIHELQGANEVSLLSYIIYELHNNNNRWLG